ncbi:MAG: DUF3592 domain-containing protein [Acidobacteriia bacterium]|nr:DUF3592 domain-containing protein [Terriglobia bacterium]
MVLVTVSLLMLRTEWQYRTNAQTTPGIVLRKYRSVDRGSSSLGARGSVSSYWVEYEYETFVGARRQDRDTVSPGYWETLERGRTVQVVYLPNRPGHSRLSRGMRISGPSIFLVVGVMFTLMGGAAEVGVLADLWRKYLKKHPHALQEGRPG